MNFMYYLLSFLSGTAISTQAAINGKLLSSLASPLLTSTVSFAVGTAGLFATYLIAVKLGLHTRRDGSFESTSPVKHSR